MPSFFALLPDRATQHSIVEWRDNALPPLAHPVHAANLHITLAWLGEVQDWQLDRLLNDSGHAGFQPLQLTLDHVGYWPKPRVLWLGCGVIDTQLQYLEKRLRNLAGSLGLPTDKRPYHPHLTLARKLDYPPPAPASEPRFEMRFDHFVLMESRRTREGGVRYQLTERFP